MSPADDHRTYSIRQLCREFGATARALRFYEDKGLLSPARKGQTRVYDSRDRARLKLILRGRRIGFTLTEIQEMLDLYDRKDGNAVQMAVSLRKHRAQLEQLKRQREDLEGATVAAGEQRFVERHLRQLLHRVADTVGQGLGDEGAAGKIQRHRFGALRPAVDTDVDHAVIASGDSRWDQEPLRPVARGAGTRFQGESGSAGQLFGRSPSLSALATAPVMVLTWSLL